MSELTKTFRNVVLVTGASGFVGASLVKRFQSDGLSVEAVTRQSKKWATEAVIFPNRVVDCYEDLDLTGSACIVHLAARVHIMSDTASNPLAEYRKANVETTLKLARRAAASGVRRFVFISSVKVNGEFTRTGRAFSEHDVPAPVDAYGVSKEEAEHGLRQIAQDTGLEVVIIRPPLVYGPGVRANFATLIRAVRSRWLLPLGSVCNQRSLVSLDNLVDFISTCVTHPNAADQTFFVSDGVDISTPELINGLAKVFGVRARLLPLPMWVLWLGASMLGQRGALGRL
jgi:nucleoside-diphosphate-sugar epimerase